MDVSVVTRVLLYDFWSLILNPRLRKLFFVKSYAMIGLEATMEMLRATPPSHIVRIEIITAPGSRYSAADNRGIVNGCHKRQESQRLHP